MADRPQPESRAELLKFPHPYEAAVTVASDIDNASCDRFEAVHALLCGREVVRPGSRAWQTLGLSEASTWYDASAGGVPGLGLDFADSFFLVADDVSMGMYRRDPAGGFAPDTRDGRDAREAIRGWLKAGAIDSFHALLDLTRDEALPLLEDFHAWCEREGVAWPRVWLNHSLSVTPTGLCPRALRPNRAVRLARHLARAAVGPLFGRRRRPLRYAFAWYDGATPGSPHYINDVLRAHGLRYVWLNSGDVLPNAVALPEHSCGGRPSILDIVTMDDGVRYYHFARCYGRPAGAPATAGLALRRAADTIDTSCLFTEENLEVLCRQGGTCILFTHWTLKRSFPVQDETIGRFALVRRYRDAGRVWVAPLARLLEWTRLRAFLRYEVRDVAGRTVIDIAGVDDPVLGRQTLGPEECGGLAFRLPPAARGVAVCIGGKALPAGAVRREGDVCWVEAAGPGGSAGGSAP